MHKKVVVIGFDGGTYSVLKPLAAEGVMPNFKRLMEKGCHGILESTMPPMTGTAWTTFATGKNPGKHGVYDFLLSNGTLEDFRVTTSRDIKGKTFYEIIDEKGLKPITINLPNSWPPRLKDKQIVITCLLTQGDQWIWPDSLKEEYPELNKYKLTPNESLRVAERHDEYIEEIAQLEHDHFAAVKKIFKDKPWNFFFYLFSATDWVQHARLDKILEERDKKSLEVYKAVDEYLGWFMNNLPKDANLLLMSDHGFKAYKKTFYFNKWLEKEGFLHTKRGAGQFKVNVTRRAKESAKVKEQKKKIKLGQGLFNVLSKFPALEKLAKKFYKKFVKKYLPVNLNVDIGIDFEKTLACFPKGSYVTNVYLNYEKKYKNGAIKTEEEYLKIRADLKRKIEAIRDPKNKPVIAKVLTKEEVYGKNAPLEAPDLFFELGDYWLDGHFGSGKLFDNDQVSNKHEKDGIFLGYGPDIKKGELPRKYIADIAPTVLHMMNIPIPKDMDGELITEIFKEKKEIIYQTEKEEVESLISDINI